MTLKSRIHFTLYFLSKRFFRFIVQLAVMVAMFFLLFVVLYMHDLSYLGRRSMEAVIDAPLRNAGSMRLDFTGDDRDVGKRNEFLRRLYDEEYITGVGCYMAGSFGPLFPELCDMQRNKADQNNYADFAGFGFSSMAYYTDPSVMKMMRIQLLEGSIEEEEYISRLDESDCMGIYLGYSYRDIPAGTEFTSEDGHLKCRVLGILEKNSQWLSQNVLSGDYLYNSNLSVVLDDLYLVVLPVEYMGSPGFVCFDDEITFQDGILRIQALADEYGLRISGESFDNLADQSEKQEIYERLLLLVLFVIMSVIFSVVVSKLQIVFILNNRFEYGVLMASGAEMKDMIILVFLESVIKWVCSMLISLMIGAVFVVKRYGLSMDYWNIMLHTIVHFVLWKYVLITVITSAVSTLFPILYIRRMSLIELFRE